MGLAMGISLLTICEFIHYIVQKSHMIITAKKVGSVSSVGDSITSVAK